MVAFVIWMITIIGVGHVFDIGGQVRQVVVSRQPTVVGVELDQERYHALNNRYGREDSGVLYRLLSHFQRRIAHEYGVEVGDEMLAATKAAGEVGADIAFLDMDSATVLSRLWGSMTFEEKVKLFVSTIAALFVGKKQVEKELKRFDEDRTSYLDEFASQFPSVKKILIDDRDKYIAQGVRQLASKYERVVAVVGEGHVDGMLQQLADLGPEVVRLRELRSATPDSNASVSFTIDPRRS
jgi:pheromone shutdown protein TraB